jgi:hypothetical protein
MIWGLEFWLQEEEGKGARLVGYILDGFTFLFCLYRQILAFVFLFYITLQLRFGVTTLTMDLQSHFSGFPLSRYRRSA